MDSTPGTRLDLLQNRTSFSAAAAARRAARPPFCAACCSPAAPDMGRAAKPARGCQGRSAARAAASRPPPSSWQAAAASGSSCCASAGVSAGVSAWGRVECKGRGQTGSTCQVLQHAAAAACQAASEREVRPRSSPRPNAAAAAAAGRPKLTSPLQALTAQHAASCPSQCWQQGAGGSRHKAGMVREWRGIVHRDQKRVAGTRDRRRASRDAGFGHRQSAETENVM